MRLQKSCSLRVIHITLLVLASIKLDHYFLLDTSEISNVLPNRVLTTKTIVIELLTT